MKNKMVIFLEVLVIMVAAIAYMVKVVIPEYRDSLGSSDSFVSSDRYQNMIEIRINQKTDFSLVIDSEGKIFHLFFFDDTSTFLSNKNIENHDINEVLSTIFSILIENNLLKDVSQIEIFRNNEVFYKEFIEKWDELILKYSISTGYLEKVVSLEERALELGLDTTSSSSILLNMDFYSKEFIKNSSANGGYSKLDNDTARVYANQVYRKIEDYIRIKKITSLDRNNDEISISLIPADSNLKYYPTTRSWYSVEEGHVFAFIEFIDDDKIFSYCYSGSIDIRKEGECES